jgi:UDP-N-acetylmuramyl tripeptide synthase
MRLVESRRITGPHLLLDRPGAGAEIELDEGDRLDDVLDRARAACATLGFPTDVVARRWPGGVSVAIEAPLDALETAAWVFDHAVEGSPDLPELLRRREAEANPALVAFVDAVRRRGLPVFWDEDGVTVGLGARGQTFPLDRLPPPESVEGGGIPFCFVTGTNGKTTTTRLIARIAREAGFVVGHTSSDGVVVAGIARHRGDWTGPGAARQVLRDTSVDFAVLETARGGLMRRGLAVTGAGAAIVTNVSDDHLGEWGICDLPSTAEMKLVVAKGVRAGGALIVNQGCAPLADVARARSPIWFGYDRGSERAAFFEGGWFHLGGAPLVAAADVPITLGGAARFNVENALGAALVAQQMGIATEHIVAGLTSFNPSPRDNAGRMNVFDHRGARVIVDFAHNPDGVRQLGAVVRALPGVRRLVVLGQAGDRRPRDVEALVDEICAIGFDRIQLKELPEHRRGKAIGEVPRMLRGMLEARGVSADVILDPPADGELAAIDAALQWAQPGDLVLLLVHEQFDDVVRRLDHS